MGVNCKVCHEETQDDGYGEPVHLNTGLYGVYGGWAADPKNGTLQHVAV